MLLIGEYMLSRAVVLRTRTETQQYGTDHQKDAPSEDQKAMAIAVKDGPYECSEEIHREEIHGEDPADLRVLAEV